MSVKTGIAHHLKFNITWTGLTELESTLQLCLGSLFEVFSIYFQRFLSTAQLQL